MSRKNFIFIVIAFLFVGYILIQYSPHHIQNENKSMMIASPLFQENTPIPVKFSCDGGNMNPELEIENVPNDAKSLALILEDPDAPRAKPFTHWIIWNINPATTVIKEESVPPASIEGMNDGEKLGYMGPCPPPGSKPHRYFFK